MSTNIRQLVDPKTKDPFFPQTDIHGLVNNGEYAIDEEPTAGSTNLVTSGGAFNAFKSEGNFDISAYNAVENTPATYETLALALAAVPLDRRVGGMSVKFIQSSDHKYVQYRLMANDWSTTVSDWQGADSEPIKYSENLVESDGVFNATNKIVTEAYTASSSKKYLNNDGSTSEAAGSVWRVRTYNITEDKDYYASGYVRQGHCGIYYYDASNNPISGEQFAGEDAYAFTKYKLTVPTGAKTVKIADRSDIQVSSLVSAVSLLDELEQEISRATNAENTILGNVTSLGNKVKEILGSGLENKMDGVTRNVGYISVGGVVSNDDYRYTNPFSVSAEDCLVILSNSSTVNVVVPVSSVSGEGTEQSPYVYTPLITPTENYTYVVYRFTADATVAVSYRYQGGFFAGVFNSAVLKYITVNRDRIEGAEEDIQEINDKIDDKDLTNNLPSRVIGSYQISNNVISLVSDAQYRHTSPFDVKAGDVIHFEGGSGMPTSRILVVGVTGDGTEQSPYVYTDLYPRTATTYMINYVADIDRKISICFRPGTAGYILTWTRKSEINNRIDDASENVYKSLKNLSNGFFTKLDVEYSEGRILTYDPYSLRSDFIYIGNIQAIRFDCNSSFSIAKYDENKELIEAVDNLSYIELNTIKDNTRYIRIQITGTEESPAVASSMTVNVKPVTAMVNNRRLMSNMNIKCLAHQGIGLNINNNARGNLLSSFWGAYLFGFDSILANLRFTQDSVAVCVHDSTVTYGETTYTIASTDYADLVSAASAAGAEKIATLDSVVKLAKMLGMGVFIVNTPTNNTQRGIMLSILGKYKMNENTILLCDDSIVDSIITAGQKNVALLQGVSVSSTDYSAISNVITRAITVSTAHPEANMYIWVNNGHSVQNFSDAAAALASYPNIKIGMYNNDTTMNIAGFIERMPYISMYSSHFSSFGQNRRQVELALAAEYPEIIGCTYGNLI